MKTMEMKIDEVHFMLSHLMKDKPFITGLEVMRYLGLNIMGFINLILDDDDNFPKAVRIEGKCSILECEWKFSRVAEWKRNHLSSVEYHKRAKVEGDHRERIK